MALLDFQGRIVLMDLGSTDLDLTLFSPCGSKAVLKCACKLLTYPESTLIG